MLLRDEVKMDYYILYYKVSVKDAELKFSLI